MGPVVLAWVVLGWLAGALVGHAVRHLLANDAPDVAPRPLAWLGPLGVDPPLQGATALAFGVLAGRLGLGLTLAIYSLYAAALLALLIVDWRTRWVYDAMAYPALAAALLLTPLATGGAFWHGLAGALIGGGVFGALYLAGRWLYRGSVPMGLGDVTLAAILGAMLGHERVVAGVLLGTLLGAAVAIGYGVRYRSLKVSMPYGPGLCLATLALLAFGS